MVVIVREPVVAGTFYNLNPDMLRKEIETCFKHMLGPKKMKEQKIIAAVVPHAGYEFSGAVAEWVYSRIEKANYIILGPNHRGIGYNYATMKNTLWKTPLGGILIHNDAVEELVKNCKILQYDFIPHQYEHSIEVQLPFLQHRFGDKFKIVPISIINEFADDTLLEGCRLLGKCIADFVKKSKEKWIILASSDFSHYVPQEIAEKTDKYVINSILKLDEKKFFQRINAKNASVCGFGGIAIAIVAAKQLKAKKGELLKYATSGDVTGDTSSVVGYASIVFY